jgi:hypothetical protein
MHHTALASKQTHLALGARALDETETTDGATDGAATRSFDSFSVIHERSCSAMLRSIKDRNSKNG